MTEDLSAYQQWLETGFQWLEVSASDQPWQESRSGFLTALGISEGDLDEPSNRVAQLVMYALDQAADQGAGAEELVQSRHDVIPRCLAQWQQELDVARAAEPEPAAGPEAAGAPEAAAAAPAPTEPQWVEGHGWMRFDPQVNDWVAVEPAAAPAGPAEPAAEAAPAAAPAADVAAPVDAMITLVMRETLAEVAEAAEIPPDEFAAMLARIIAEELAARSE